MTTTTRPTPDASDSSIPVSTEKQSPVATAMPEKPSTPSSLELKTDIPLKPPSIEEARALWAMARS